MDFEYVENFFLFYPPRDEPGGWNLDLAAFREALTAGFPGAYGDLAGEGTRLPRMDFWARTDDDVEFDGLASVEGRDCVAVGDNTVAEAARFVVWLRAAVVPQGAEIWFSSRAAVEAGFDEREWPVPAGADRAGVEAALRRHLADVHGAEVASAYEAARAEGDRWEVGGL